MALFQGCLGREREGSGAVEEVDMGAFPVGCCGADDPGGGHELGFAEVVEDGERVERLLGSSILNYAVSRCEAGALDEECAGGWAGLGGEWRLWLGGWREGLLLLSSGGGRWL